MRRVQLAVLAVAGVLVAAVWTAVGVAAVDGTTTRDPDPPGVDTLDRAAVERLARIRLPADATDLHTRYAEGIDYVLTLCFTTTRAALPAFLAAGELPPPRPGAEVVDLQVPPGCPALVAPVGTDEDTATGVYRRLVVADLPDGRLAVRLRAFTT